VLDSVTVSEACAAISVACAVVQVFYARMATRVALKIASDQAAETIRARDEAAEAKREAIRRFIETVLSIGSEALNYTEASLGGMREGPSPNIPRNWRQRLTEYRGALDLIRGASPPDARLLLAVARLSRALEYPSELPQGPYPNEQVLRRVTTSLTEELNFIEDLAIRAGCHLSNRVSGWSESNS
jgi:hypothetical protein